jgi:hypothetical protein
MTRDNKTIVLHVLLQYAGARNRRIVRRMEAEDMTLNRMTRAEMISLTESWVTPTHSERQTLAALLSAGVIRFMESAHGDVLGTLDGAEAERVSGLSGDLGATNERHDDLARIIHYVLRAHEILHRRQPRGRDVADARAWLFPDDLAIVRAGYRESAGRAAARTAQLTPERQNLLAAIPVEGNNLLTLVLEWNQMGAQMGALHDQRATPGQSAAERVGPRAARGRWIRAVKTVLNALEIEAETNPGAQRILERVANLQAEVRRRLGSGASAPGDDEDDGTDVDDGPEETAPTA